MPGNSLLRSEPLDGAAGKQKLLLAAATTAGTGSLHELRARFAREPAYMFDSNVMSRVRLLLVMAGTVEGIKDGAGRQAL